MGMPKGRKSTCQPNPMTCGDFYEGEQTDGPFVSSGETE